jgi:TrmH family RNA methyltransferase
MPVYGTFLDGTDIYGQELSASGIIVMGNEGNGISKEVAELVTQRLYIPNFPKGSPTTESLNVAIATGIVCAEFRRRASS